jgi:D5 N terminal like
VERPPDLDALAAAADDRTGEKLAALVRAAHGSTTADDPFASADNFGKPSPWDDLDATIANNSRHDAVHKLASALRGRGGWRAGDALAYIREIVWPKLDQTRNGHPYTSDELESDIRDAFTRYDDGPSEKYRPTQPTVVDPETDPFDGAGEGLNDAMLCAEVAKNVLTGRYRWARGLGWLAWTGIRWTPAPDQAVAEETRRYLLAQWRRAVQRLEPAKTDEERKAGEQVVGSWRGTLGKSRITAITTLAQGIATILTDPANLDAHPDLLNVGNGVVDLRTGLLSDHDPDLLLSLHTPVAYRSDATHPDWDAALAAIPADVRGWLQRRYGQGVTGHMTPTTCSSSKTAAARTERPRSRPRSGARWATTTSPSRTVPCSAIPANIPLS